MVNSLLQANGWYLVNTVGSHRQYKHPQKPGRVTVPHPLKDLPMKTVKSIERQAGIKF
ncbi:type II toxin-antitoxin system HicA family toxin [Bacillus weihaiensis]|uniref:type II toxin-antitoxin system HicA family toxin n=1 Tax=Bacillus weihaiensis TaxID=1547283 RepID=UPI00235630D3|nr:type II toxin-antitoxin system HicA family toxin [Bacillus weihaiensis]